MRLFPTLLSLSVIAQFATGEPPPTIELPANPKLEILDPTVVQNCSTVAVAGRVKRIIPWADTSWDHIELTLLDENGSAIVDVATDYSPRPIPRAYRSAYEPSSRFEVRIKGITKRVYAVRIACFPGSVSESRALNFDIWVKR
jgi:hypothetical protein